MKKKEGDEDSFLFSAHTLPQQETNWNTQQYKLHEAVVVPLYVCTSLLQRFHSVTVVTSQRV